MDLNGGHSGKDIAENRGNPIIVLGNILAKLNTNSDLFLNFIDGGTWVTAIPRKAECIITTNPLDINSLCIVLQKLEEKLQKQHDNPNIFIELSQISPMDLGFDKETSSNIIKYISKFPNGQILNKKNSNDTLLSANLGTVITNKNKKTKKHSKINKNLLCFFSREIFFRANMI